MRKNQRINKPEGINFLRLGRSKNNTSPSFSLRWYDLLIGVTAIMLVVCTVFGYAAAKSKSGGGTDIALSDIELLGKYVFFDNISNPPRMSCSTCHAPRAGWTYPVSGVNQHQVVATGADPHTSGGRRPPNNSYATFIPPFTPNDGGNFWDGRAEGNAIAVFPDGATKHIGDEVFQGLDVPPLEYAQYFGPVADQALNPMPNIVEQNIERQAVCQHVASAKYAELYEMVWGVEIDCSDDPVEESAPDVEPPEKAFDISFKRIMLAVCAWQASYEVNSFSSKLDAAIAAAPKDEDGRFTFPLAGLTDQENEGHDLFYGRPTGCAFFCHNSGAIGGPSGNITDGNELYTADGYFNIGIPANPEIPGFDPENPDLGLFEHTGVLGDEGEFKIPTMRNVDKRPGKGFTKAYGHNGWFKSLESIVHFYNTRDVKPVCPDDITTEKDALANDCWPPPEVPENVTGAQRIGNMGFTPEQEAAIVAYLKTLTDSYTPKKPKPYK
jgi:cytochrome c peroxidase